MGSLLSFFLGGDAAAAAGEDPSSGDHSGVTVFHSSALWQHHFNSSRESPQLVTIGPCNTPKPSCWNAVELSKWRRQCRTRIYSTCIILARILLCIEKALAQSGVSSEDVNYINAHAASTPAGDLIEFQALMHYFGQNPDLRVNSSKSMIDHLLGAAGAVEAVATIQLARKNISKWEAYLAVQCSFCRYQGLHSLRNIFNSIDMWSFRNPVYISIRYNWLCNVIT